MSNITKTNNITLPKKQKLTQITGRYAPNIIEMILNLIQDITKFTEKSISKVATREEMTILKQYNQLQSYNLFEIEFAISMLKPTQYTHLGNYKMLLSKIKYIVPHTIKQENLPSIKLNINIISNSPLIFCSKEELEKIKEFDSRFLDIEQLILKIGKAIDWKKIKTLNDFIKYYPYMENPIFKLFVLGRDVTLVDENDGSILDSKFEESKMILQEFYQIFN